MEQRGWVPWEGPDHGSSLGLSAVAGRELGLEDLVAGASRWENEYFSPEAARSGQCATASTVASNSDSSKCDKSFLRLPDF